MQDRIHDLLVIGGGINGAGIARDAAGRGLSVLLVEKDDLASHTSSESTKLIHGGLRYLEHFEFRLVGESLAEREILLRAAPHIIEPLMFVLPHEPHLRPKWMLRIGLFLYDRLGGKTTLPRSFGVRLKGSRWGAGLKPRFRRGFAYADARVDDARLVVLNALDAKRLGSEIHVHTRFVRAIREDGAWRATLARDSETFEMRARAIVNAAGPWVKDVLDTIRTVPGPERVRHVKGSHIVVPRIYPEEHAYILQNADERIVFVIPYQQDYSLIGTTDVPVEEYESPSISEEEIDYLLTLSAAYLERPLTREEIVWTYSGVRPLYDDGSDNPSAVTRDYVLHLDVKESTVGGHGRTPLLSVFGGKITTYRKLAEQAMAELAPYFPDMKGEWTKGAILPGGDLPKGDRNAWLVELFARYPKLPEPLVRVLAHRYGTRATLLLDEARSLADLGLHFGAGLTAREVDFLVEHEWAQSADDILWRRTKCGLRMTPAERERVGAYLATRRSA
jgi:glycerol-3-phosphate dehydrogenase